MSKVTIIACFISAAIGLMLPIHWISAQNQPLGFPTTQPDSITASATPAHPSDVLPVQHANPLAAAAPDAEFQRIRGSENFWRLVQDQKGVWWFQAPDGRLEFMNTVTTVQPFQEGNSKDGAFNSRDFNGKDLSAWARATLPRVLEAGFKGLGAWCNPAFHQLDVPMTRDLNLWMWVKDGSKRFYSPEWESMADHAAQTQLLPLKESKNLVGYFIDNELDWGESFAGAGAYFDHLSAEDPNRVQVMAVLHSLWPNLDEFNLAWETKITDWNQVQAWATLPREPAATYSRLGQAWLSHLAEDYFKTTTAIIHKYDPNHLILGVRFQGYAQEEVVAASRNYTDAQSLNFYAADAQLNGEMFRMMYQRSGQPIIISEYSFHSLDGASGNRDLVGFPGQVPDQQARADGYRLMTSRLARVPYIVGADWFQWADEPAQGRTDGEDVNFGVVDIHDKPYELLLDSIRKTAPLLNPLHGKSATDSQEDVWRESYANKPIMHVPYMSRPPLLNGDLKTWVPESRLENIRREHVVDVERRPVQTPNVFIGWTEKGLYLGMEVFDDHRQAVDPGGAWWTRDQIELWISTRPVASNQTSYDANCHQFFFVPTGGPQNSGQLGQWHRDGDALKDNLIPAPGVKQSVKLEKDRYILEAFIPAKDLHGYDPLHQPALAFNLHIRNFSDACDFFWSAPKCTQTQFRPNTWGTLYLEPAPAIMDFAGTAQALAR
jgi:agarase